MTQSVLLACTGAVKRKPFVKLPFQDLASLCGSKSFVEAESNKRLITPLKIVRVAGRRQAENSRELTSVSDRDERVKQSRLRPKYEGRAQ